MKALAGVAAHRLRDKLLADNKFDGDTCSLISLLTEESKAEIAKKLNSKNFYVAPDGRMAFSPGDDIIDLTLRCITGD